MFKPAPALAPVTPPVMAPIVHEKVLITLAVKVIFGPVPLQMLTAGALVTTGLGLTVTVIVKGVPGQEEPPIAVGVTIY